MSDIVISVENVSKMYQLGTIGSGTFRGDVRRWWAGVRGLPDPELKVGESDVDSRASKNVWAVKDVGFQVRQGEALGIIGRNGAGKSTLLKILSRVTAPTSGLIKAKGRIASLLEVGTGFHAELTGRENIFLNGAILGMRRSEIQRKLDEIVDFSGVEKYIDTPVKRYSSGMYVRLAFAVGAHLDPDILVVDEVLAVGDAEFQKKCLGQMNDSTFQGRTVLFVSHNQQAIQNLCTRCVLLNKGEVLVDAPTEETMGVYRSMLHKITIDADTGIGDEQYRRGMGSIRFTSITLKGLDGTARYTFGMGETIRFEMSYEVFKEIQGLAVTIVLRSTLTGDILTSVRHLLSSDNVIPGTAGMVAVDLTDVYIRPGEYILYLHISGAVPNETNFDVLDDLTPRLMITTGEKQQHYNFDATNPKGYFSIPSRLVSSKSHRA